MASVCATQAHMHASSVFDENVESMSVKLTMKRMQGYMPPRKAGKLNMALVSRLKLLGKAAKACWLLLACTFSDCLSWNFRDAACSITSKHCTSILGIRTSDF